MEFKNLELLCFGISNKDVDFRFSGINNISSVN